jgi:hypothetical protein
MKKKIALFAAAFFFTKIFALGGALATSSGPIFLIQTEFFDIIFPEECRESAEKIQSVSDDYYREICGILGTDCYQRFPVTLTDGSDSLNGYFTQYPYNSIVLYDTIPDRSLSSLDDTILDVFRHELTHAVTFNMKTPLFRKLSVLGDQYSFFSLNLTSFWAEGATVSFESAQKGGRLNDPFSTQKANAAKNEGKKISWRDVTGARDTFPYGNDAYIFGGMFAEYLQKKFGMEKYGEFWYCMGSNFSLAFAESAFKKTFGVTLNQEWAEFYSSLDLMVTERGTDLLSAENSAVTSMDVFCGDDGTKIAWFDSVSQSLKMISISPENRRGKKLLSATGISRVSFNEKGTDLALSRTVTKINYKKETAIFSLKKKGYRCVKKSGVREAFFREKDGNEKFSYAEISEKNFLSKSDDDIPKFSADEIIFSPVSFRENVAAIIKKGLSWKIRLYLHDGTVTDFDFSKIMGTDSPRNLILQNLHHVFSDERKSVFTFSWAELGKGGKMFSRAGLFVYTENSSFALLQKENISGGIIDCDSDFSAENLITGTDSATFFVVTDRFDKNPLYKIEFFPEDFETVPIEQSVPTKEFPAQTENSPEKQEEKGTDKFRPAKYAKKGTVFFDYATSVYNFDLEEEDYTQIGLSYTTAAPWTDNFLTIAASYDIDIEKAEAGFLFSGGDAATEFKFGGTGVFGKSGFLQSSQNFSAEKTIFRGLSSSFSAGISEILLYGKQVEQDKIRKNFDDTKGISFDTQIFARERAVHKTSTKTYHRAGFELKPFLLFSYRDSEMRTEDLYINLGVTLNLYAVPVVPVILSANLYPSQKYLASFSAEAILFCHEIQKGIPKIYVYANRFMLGAKYSGKIGYEHGEFFDISRTIQNFTGTDSADYSDSLTFSASLVAANNTGAAVAYATISANFIYRFNPEFGEKKSAVKLKVKLNL